MYQWIIQFLNNLPHDQSNKLMSDTVCFALFFLCAIYWKSVAFYYATVHGSVHSSKDLTLSNQIFKKKQQQNFICFTLIEIQIISPINDLSHTDRGVSVSLIVSGIKP